MVASQLCIYQSKMNEIGDRTTSVAEEVMNIEGKATVDQVKAWLIATISQMGRTSADAEKNFKQGDKIVTLYLGPRWMFGFS